MISIREVAKIAGVSPATVSRVINGTANVAPDKAQRVYEAVKQTGFVPNEVARSLFKKSGKIIGLIIPSITNPFFTELADAVEKAADEIGFRIVYYNTDNNIKKEKNAVHMLQSMNADGIIVTSNNKGLMDTLDKSGMKVVMIDRTMSEDCADMLVTSDHYYGGRIAARHLLDCGCRNIVCVRGRQSISSARDRYRGYRDVCRENNIGVHYVESPYGFTFEENVIDEIYSKCPEVDGIFACNDLTALFIYKLLHNKGVKVPEEVAIVGFDDVMISKLVTPELTTISQPIEQMGRTAVDMLIGNNDNSEQKAVIFKPELKIRQTTKIKQPADKIRGN